MATQALGDLPPAVQAPLADAYTRQRELEGFIARFENALMVALPEPRGDWSRGLFMLDQGMREIGREERTLLTRYDRLLPALESARARAKR